MKPLFFILSLLLSQPLFGKDKDLKMNCGQFRTGKFVMDDTLIGRTIIERYDSLQIETIVSYNCMIELHIKWVDDCTYVLTFSRVIKDPDNNTRDLDKTMVLNNTITNVTGNSYTQVASSASSPMRLIYKITKIK